MNLNTKRERERESKTSSISHQTQSTNQINYSEWACSHYDAANNQKLKAECRNENILRINEGAYLLPVEPVMINKAGKKICIVCYQYTKEYMDDYQARSAQHLADMLPPNYSLPTHLQVKFQQLKDKVFTNTDQAGPIVDEIEQWIFSHQGEIKEVWESYVRKDEKKRSFPDVKSVPQRLPLNSPVKNTVQGNEQIQTNNSSNLVFYLLGGLVGLGLISLISYLIIKAKKGKKE